MPIDRRALLIGAGAGLALSGPAVARSDRREDLYAAAGKLAGGGHAAVVFGSQRGEISRTALPVRGHAVAVRPGTRDCVVFARSPGTVAVCLDAEGRRQPVRIGTRADRHFQGHGTFSRDGRLLFATENDFEAVRGVVVVRNATAGYRRIGEFASGGIGPHDLALLADGRTLVVANGGLRTHPDYGGEPLNLASMKPALTYIDIVTGDVQETHSLARELHKLSIRHLSVAADDTVVFACQHKGARTRRPALIGFHRRGEDLQLIDLPRSVHRAMRGHIGSVEVDRTGQLAAATSPRGGLAVFLDVTSRRYLGHIRLDEVCGVAARRRRPGFLLTGGSGELSVTPDGQRVDPLRTRAGNREIVWDNHAATL